MSNCLFGGGETSVVEVSSVEELYSSGSKGEEKCSLLYFFLFLPMVS